MSKAGNYSQLIVNFELEREVGHYIMDYYVPSIMLVVVSWVSFWLDPNAVPGRTTLGKYICSKHPSFKIVFTNPIIFLMLYVLLFSFILTGYILVSTRYNVGCTCDSNYFSQ